MKRKMTYRELLELTRKYPNPFSVEGRKNRFYDFEVKNHDKAKDKGQGELYYEDEYK